MGKNTKASNLGRSLIRDRFNRGSKRTVDNNSMVIKYALTKLSNCPNKNTCLYYFCSCTQLKFKTDTIGVG